MAIRLALGEILQAYTYELKQIMTPERRYVIPTFQRDYEWTKDGQWQLLFEDLDTAAERLGEARAHAEVAGTSRAAAEKGVSPHFLGAVVCEQLPSPAGGLDLRAVIDGQQRLTTLQLLVRGVLDVLLERKSPRVKQVRRLIENPDDVVNEAHEKHKLWPRRKDRLVWPAAMGDAAPPAKGHPYLEARTFFAEATREASIGVDGSDRLDDIVDALLDLFKLVVIDLEDNDDAQVIFEVLNGRQTPLSASDLVKNLLFLRGELANEHEIDRLYDDYWAEFDDPWWKVQVGTGHAARARRDVVLSVWLTATSGSEASVAHLYGQVRAYLSRGDRKTEDVLIEMHAYGQAYKAIYGASEEGSKVLRHAYRHLDKLKILTAVPLLAWLRTLPPSKLSPEEHQASVQAIESWSVRRMITGANTRGYNSAFLAVLKAAQRAAGHAESSISTAIVQALAESPNSLRWPDDDAVLGAFAGSRYYGSLTQERIRLLLGAIDEQMRFENKKTESAVFDYDSLQIEHLMPQGWREHWTLTNDLEDNAALALAQAERDAAVHRMGNLTLVSSTFNQSVSNSAWSVKRPELAAQSSLQLNAPIAANEDWNEGRITERAADLATIACRVWPGPVGTSSGLGLQLQGDDQTVLPSSGGARGGPVYLLKGSGSRFHIQPECAGITSAQARKPGLMVRTTSREEAEASGRTPCQLGQCWG